MATRGKRGNYQFLNHVSPTKGVYSLIVRQQPVKSKVSPVADKTGAGEKKAIDPAVIVELKITDEAEKPASPDPAHYLYNPFLFAYATLLDPDSLEEIPYMDDSMHILTGSIASCVYHLKDPENDNQFGAFFVFPDIAIRQEGKYRLKISLYKITGNVEDSATTNSKVVLLQSVNTDVFQVYPIKGFPPLLPSSLLSRSFADQGLKLRLRKSTKTDGKKDDDDSSENESPRITSATSSGHPDLALNRKRAAEPAPPARSRPPPDAYGGAPHPYYYRPPPMGYPPYPPPPGAYGAPPPGYPYYYHPPPHDQHHPGYPPVSGYPPSHERPPYPGHHERPPYPGHYDGSYHPHYPPPQYPPQRSASAAQGSSTVPARPPYPFPNTLPHPAGAPGHSSAPSPTQASAPSLPKIEDGRDSRANSIDGSGMTTRQSPTQIDPPSLNHRSPVSPKLPGREELSRKEEEVLRTLASASAHAGLEHAPKRTRLDADQGGSASAPTSTTSDKPPAVSSATSTHSLPPPQLPSDRPRRLSIPGRDHAYPPGGPPHHYPLPPPGQHPPYYYGYPPPPGSYSARPRPPPAGYDGRNPYPPPPPHYQPYYLPPPPGARGYGHPPPPPHSGPQSAPVVSSGPPPLASPAIPPQAHHDSQAYPHPPTKE